MTLASSRAAAIDVVQSPGRLRGGRVSALRRSVIEHLREPTSATALAAQLGESRQRINYHVRELEKAGLVHVVEERPRRGCTERIVKLTARALVVGPDVIGDLATASQDRFATDMLLAIAARTLIDVAAMRERARADNRRLVTFAIEADVGFEQPADIERFVDQLANRVTDLVAHFDTGRSQRRYRLVIGGHPAPRQEKP